MTKPNSAITGYHIMKKDTIAIALTTIVLFTYCLLSQVQDISYYLIGLLFLLLHVLIIWMVIAILKQPNTVTKTFDEHFYQDRESSRNLGE